MGFTGDERVRPIVDGILRSAPWTHPFLCCLCLLNLTLEQLVQSTKSTKCVARWIGFSGTPESWCTCSHSDARSVNTRWRASAPGDLPTKIGALMAVEPFRKTHTRE